VIALMILANSVFAQLSTHISRKKPKALNVNPSLLFTFSLTIFEWF
jgi:hypothetical protein